MLGGFLPKVARSSDCRGLFSRGNAARRPCDELAWIEDTLSALISGLLIGLAQYQAGLTPCYVMAAMPCYARAIQADSLRRVYMLLLIVTSALVVIPRQQLAANGSELLYHLIVTALVLTIAGLAAQSWGRASNPLILASLVLWLPLEHFMHAGQPLSGPSSLASSSASTQLASPRSQNAFVADDNRLCLHPAIGSDSHGVEVTRPRELRSVRRQYSLNRLRWVQPPAEIVLALPPFRSPPGATPGIGLGGEDWKT